MRPSGLLRPPAGTGSTGTVHGSSMETVLPPSLVGRTVSLPPHSAVSQRMITMPRPLSCWTAAGSRFGKRGWLSVTPMRNCSSRSRRTPTVKVGDCPNVCWTALVASSDTISRTVSAASQSRGRPHSASTSATNFRATETEAGSLGSVTDASW